MFHQLGHGSLCERDATRTPGISSKRIARATLLYPNGVPEDTILFITLRSHCQRIRCWRPRQKDRLPVREELCRLVLMSIVSKVGEGARACVCGCNAISGHQLQTHNETTTSTKLPSFSSPSRPGLE